MEAIGGDDAAARAAADGKEALAAMQDAAVRYVRVQVSEMFLSWAVDRFRKEKQGPLLKRAGELFGVLTLNSFEKLEVGFDERDQMHLTGVRPNGEVVPVPGLSSGTEDQLFMALRIAAVEDYLARAVALPFVADDLFINFDPERSAAGFEVLGQLAERTPSRILPTRPFSAAPVIYLPLFVLFLPVPFLQRIRPGRPVGYEARVGEAEPDRKEDRSGTRESISTVSTAASASPASANRNVLVHVPGSEPAQANLEEITAFGDVPEPTPQKVGACDDPEPNSA